MDLEGLVILNNLGGAKRALVHPLEIVFVVAKVLKLGLGLFYFPLGGHVAEEVQFLLVVGGVVLGDPLEHY